MQIQVVRGDIADVAADAVVTAGNSSLVGGSGVNGAVHAAAGPELMQALRPLAPCPAGSAVVTPAFAMPKATWVIHAVGPRYAGPEDAAVLASAYTAALVRADEVGARTVAFPSISTGVYGYPEADAARVSVAALRAATTAVETVLLVAFGGRTAQLWERELAATRTHGPCPHDGTETAQPPRYPEALCRSCAGRATDLAGRAVQMYNVSLTGGFEARHADDKTVCEQVTRDGRVLIDGKAYRAGEARFGGVVIQPLAD
jgi:O-acetyl-ADP-ribose deacetylase (regulator of RNase III)